MDLESLKAKREQVQREFDAAEKHRQDYLKEAQRWLEEEMRLQGRYQALTSIIEELEPEKVAESNPKPKKKK